MNPSDTNANQKLDDSTVDAIVEIDEKIAAGEPICESDSSQVDADVEGCLQLLDRVRRHSPHCVADLEAESWIDGGREFPPQIGRFRITRKLGQGGFGVVFLAYDPELDRELALKVPRIEALVTEETRERFLREGKAAASLDHANIAAVYEAGRIGPICYIASVYCGGGSLADLLKAARGGHGVGLPPNKAAELMLTLADAVQHAHSRGILHRDLKPGNILFEDAQPLGSKEGTLACAARIVDFGLAKTIEGDDVTRSGAMLGTPAYMSPEQAAADNALIGPATDVYSLGSILYELLTGKAPLKKESDVGTIVAVKHEEPVPPRRLNRNCPPDLEAICQKCLEKSPQQRYHSATELADELRRFLSGQPVLARPIRRTEMLRRWSRRNPGFASLSATLLSLLLLLVAGSTTAAVLLAQARKQTLDSLEEEILAKDRATKSETLALKAVFEARLGQVRAGRQSRAPGQRLDGLDAVTRAAKLIPRLKLGDEEILTLRNEAIACLALVDLADDKQWPVDDPDLAFATDADNERYAYAQAESGDIIVRSLTDNELIATLRQEFKGDIRNLLFSSDGAYLACSWDRAGKLPRVQVWDIKRQEVAHWIKCSDFKHRTFDFANSSEWFAVGREDNSWELLSIPEFRPLKSFPGDAKVGLLRCRQDGSQCCIHRSGQLQIIDTDTGKVVRSIECPDVPNDLDWSPDGTLLASTGYGRVMLWRTRTGGPYRYLSHPPHVHRVRFHPSGRVLATYSNDNRTRLYDINDGSRLLIVGGESYHFSSDGEHLGKRAGRWRVAVPGSHISYRQPRLPGAISSTGKVTIHKDGRLVSASNRSQTVFRDLVTGATLAVIPIEDSSGAFSPTGKEYVTATVDGLLTQSVTMTYTDHEILCRIGPVERITKAAAAAGPVVFDDSGEVISSVDRYNLHRVVLHNTRTGFSGMLLPRHRGARWSDMPVSGDLLATGAWRGENVHVWDTATGKLSKTLAVGNAQVAFSPDGAMLALDEGRSFAVWRVGDWTRIVERTKKLPGTIEPGSLTYSPDGRILTVLASQNKIKLFDTNGFSELAELALPVGSIIESLTFTPSGDRLLAGVRGHWSSLHVWDLALLRSKLRQMQLDWSHPPMQTHQRDDPLPLRLDFQTVADEQP